MDDQFIAASQMFLFDSEYNFFREGKEVIVCPICKFEYVHFKHPKVTHSGLETVGTGGAIHIPMNCEVGHRWTLVISHHKGNSYMSIEVDEQKK